MGWVIGVQLLVLFLVLDYGYSQQAYFNNKQFACTINSTNTLGYTCNGPSKCTSYLTFRSTATYSNVPSIAYLLSVDPASLAEANNVTDVSSFPENHLLYVPVNCSCSGTKLKYYQHNASYKLKQLGETYLTMANDTYEGLTTCQAMIAQNNYGIQDLKIGDQLVAPLMCACPSVNQTSKGYNYVVSFIASWNDDVSTIASLFGVDEQSILDANELDNTSTTYPFNPILVPLKTLPTNIQLNTPNASSPTNPPTPPPSSSSSSSSDQKWAFLGIGIGIGAALSILFFFLFLLWRRNRNTTNQHHNPKGENPPSNYTTSSNNNNNNSWSISTDGVRYAIESLTVYKVEELNKATMKFSESKRIKGSVYRGEFNGDSAAVKVLNGDVSAEINILKQINHSNIIRLSGFCVHGGNTYLVYEFAENGSLGDKILSPSSLNWKQRVHIAYEVAEALNYLHNYCNPPYVHKNLSSTNVLLDSNFRPKITNFGLARTVGEDEDEMHLTKHVVGNKGYLPPEYIENGVVTPKMDVYAFGMLILELMSGKLQTAASMAEVLQGENVREKLSKFMDGGLRDCYPFDLAYSLAQLANMCLEIDLNSRLSISEALVPLSNIQSSSLDWDSSTELDRSSSLTQGR